MPKNVGKICQRMLAKYAKECSNYRTIALISHASKVILKICNYTVKRISGAQPFVDRGNRGMTNKNFLLLCWLSLFICIETTEHWQMPAHLLRSALRVNMGRTLTDQLQQKNHLVEQSSQDTLCNTFRFPVFQKSTLILKSLEHYEVWTLLWKAELLEYLRWLIACLGSSFSPSLETDLWTRCQVVCL